MYIGNINIGTLSLTNNVFLAPMAGITDLMFRILAREFGSSLCFTEMISANGLVRKTERSYLYLESSALDRPLGVQIFGSDPHILSDAAQIVVERGADLVDINMGCPVKKVLRTGSGAFLMRETEKVTHILKMVRKAISVPLTIKIRSGWKGTINAEDIAERAQDCGVDAVILHPRTVEQGFSGAADWGLIRRVKDRLRIPVVGSGDIRTPMDVVGMIDESGCDGVMVGRGALGNPWIFKKILDYPGGGDINFPSLAEREYIIGRHLDMMANMYGEKIGMKKFRKHLLWYTKGLKGGAQFRQAAVSIGEMGAMLDAVHTYLHPLAKLNSEPIPSCLQRD
jgi:tRNA-dihydrouridine synthase B